MIFTSPDIHGDTTGTYLKAPSDDSTGTFDWSKAVSAAENYNGEGFSDWRLPSQNELDAMCDNRDIIGSFLTVNYWGSYEFDDFIARFPDFYSGFQSNFPSSAKVKECYVRPVRAFYS